MKFVEKSSVETVSYSLSNYFAIAITQNKILSTFKNKKKYTKERTLDLVKWRTTFKLQGGALETSARCSQLNLVFFWQK